jgi:hypothetical protein
MHDRVRHRRALDRGFLGELGTEIAAEQKPLGAARFLADVLKKSIAA